MNIDKKDYGTTPSGEKVSMYTLSHDQLSVSILDYGGIVTSLMVPDRDGNMADVVLGFDKLEDYLERSPWFGCITGRYANRIYKGAFSIDGKNYQLATNDGNNHLHGGPGGLDKHVWQAETKEEGDVLSLVLSRTSPDGEENYPGNLQTVVTYSIRKGTGDFSIQYHAETDQATPVNLTHHSYFNLAGEGSGDVLEHELLLNASQITSIDNEAIPDGNLMKVTNTPLDFTTPHQIGQRIHDDHLQMVNGNGYDHNWVIDKEPGKTVCAARVTDLESGRVMEVHTDQPGIQFYSGNFLDGIVGKNGHTYHKHNGLCLETQLFPDSPNQPNFPCSILTPGNTYSHYCLYRFIIL